MAKLTEKNAVTTLADTDLVHVVQDVPTTPVSKKMTLAQLQSLYFDKVKLIEQTSDPDDPDDGESVIWQSNGDSANEGDEGDIMIKISVGSVTKTVTLVDFSVA